MHDPKPCLRRLHGVSKTSHGWCGGLEGDTLQTVHVLACDLGVGWTMGSELHLWGQDLSDAT